MMEIKTTSEIASDTGKYYNTKWVAVDDLIAWARDYECPHSSIVHLECNCCDGVGQLKQVLTAKTKIAKEE